MTINKTTSPTPFDLLLEDKEFTTLQHNLSTHLEALRLVLLRFEEMPDSMPIEAGDRLTVTDLATMACAEFKDYRARLETVLRGMA